MSAIYDPSVWFDAFRSAFAPWIRAQEKGLKAMDRLARLQYAIAGDCLECGLAQAHAVLEAVSPADFVAKETELGAKLGEKIRSRSQEFVDFTVEAQSSVRAAGEAGSKGLPNRRRKRPKRPRTP